MNILEIPEFLHRVVYQNCLYKFDKQEIRDQPVKPYTHDKLGRSIFTLHHHIDLTSVDKQEIKDYPVKPYKLGRSIFTFHHQIDLSSVAINALTAPMSLSEDNESVLYVPDIVMMDDGRLVTCLPNQNRLLICNTDGSQEDSIPVQGIPYCVTAINNSTVAVILRESECIVIFDINNKLKLQSISVPEMCWVSGITTINTKLVVSGDNCLQIIDLQTKDMVQTKKTDCQPWRVHGSGNRIFYCNTFNSNKLYWYSYTDDRHHTLTLPSHPMCMTTLEDGSLYVMCENESVQHVSSDGKQYKTIKTKGLKQNNYFIWPKTFTFMSYNSKQRKLFALENLMLILKVFYEK